MAITINSSTNTHSAAYNQMLFNISSNNTAQPNFYFVADVYVRVSGVDVLAARLLYPKQLGSTSVTIDISDVIKNYVTYQFGFGSSVTPDLNGQIDYFVQFGEAYDVGIALTFYTNLARNPSSNYKYAYNLVFGFEDAIGDVMNEYRTDNFGFLTYETETQQVEQGDKVLWSYFDPSGITRKITILKGEEYSEVITPTSGKFKYNVVPTILMSVFFPAPNLYETGEYTIQLKDQFDQVLCTKLLNVNTPCGKYETFRLHWFNTLGGWDSYNFTKVDTQSINIDRKSFKKIQSMPYAVSDRLVTPYNTRITDEITINSDWVSDDVAEWIENLFTSPVVFLERQNPTELTPVMIAINVTNSSYEKRKFSNGRQLHNVTLTFNYSYDRYTQSQ
jgi:hypothetical protein